MAPGDGGGVFSTALVPLVARSSRTVYDKHRVTGPVVGMTFLKCEMTEVLSDVYKYSYVSSLLSKNSLPMCVVQLCTFGTYVGVANDHREHREGLQA